MVDGMGMFWKSGDALDNVIARVTKVRYLG